VDQRVSSWVELQERLYEGSWHEPLGRFLSDFAFRGMSRADADLARRIVVPAELKWEIRDKLDQANIAEHVLFPGHDALSRWVARYYTPR
jgi:hypothetical protein